MLRSGKTPLIHSVERHYEAPCISPFMFFKKSFFMSQKSVKMYGKPLIMVPLSRGKKERCEVKEIILLSVVC